MSDSSAQESSGVAGAPAPAEPVSPASPGRLLRQARERAGLGAEDLAGQLKLAKGTLEALERDDFLALSEPVYVRGYYRKIAKVLPVPEADLIAAYDALSKPAATTPAMRRIPLAGGVAAGTSRQHRGQGLWVAAGVLILVGILFALAEREPPQRLVPVEAPVPENAPAVPAPAPESAAPVTSAAPSVAPDSAPSAAAAAPAATVPTPAPAATAPPPAAVPDQIVLEFSESSFVRIEDSRGRTLAIGLVRGGERQALDGQPPYTVFLGNAQNVRVFFNGQPVDFSPHINSQNDTARFTVP